MSKAVGNMNSGHVSGIIKLAAAVLLLPLFCMALQGCGGSKILVLSGTVESTQIDVNSEVSGKIISLGKEEGAYVKKGDILASVDSEVQKLNVEQQKAVVRLKQAKLDEMKAGTRVEQIRQAEASVKAAGAKLEELQAGTRIEQVKQAEAAAEGAAKAVDVAVTGVDSARINYEYWLDRYNKVKELFDRNSASEESLKDARYKSDTAEQQLIAAGEQVDTARAQLKSAQAQLALLKNGATPQSVTAARANYEQAAAQLELLKKGTAYQSIQAAEADLEQSKASLAQAELVLSRFDIGSPAEGTYITCNINPGDMVNSGTSIGVISDLTDLWVRVYIMQRYLRYVSLGQEIRLKSISLPDRDIKGKIVFIAGEAEFTPRNVETNEAKENTVFKVKIRIMDNISALKPGMTIDAGIPLE